MSNQLQTLETGVMNLSHEFAKVAIDPNIKFKAEANFALQALTNNEYLLKVASANPQSLYDAVTNISAIGISLNPASKQAYLVPRKSKVCLDISYMGMMQLAQQSKSILWGQAIIVRKNDTFERQGIDKAPVHKFNDFDTSEERGEIVGVYSVFKLPNGDYLTHTMRISDVYDIRNRSESYKGGNKSPWRSDEEEMIKKTCIKQAYKTLPKNERIDKAIHHLDTDGGEGIDFSDSQSQIINGEPENPDIDRLVDFLTNESQKGMSHLEKAWKSLTRSERKIIGNAKLNTFKEYASEVDAQTVDHEVDNGTTAN